MSEAHAYAAVVDTPPRERILRAALQLLSAGGRAAVSTRAVCEAAGVQGPTIYRQFGDMQGLLDAVTAAGFADYLHEKTTRERAADPVEDLRRGWDLHVEFGLANPAVYALMYGDPRPGTPSQAAKQAEQILHGLLQRAAEAGRLRVGIADAAAMINAAGVGVVLTLLAKPASERDHELSERTREAVLAATTTDVPLTESGGAGGRAALTATAVTFKAQIVDRPDGFTPAEHQLLDEWLDRLV